MLQDKKHLADLTVTSGEKWMGGLVGEGTSGFGAYGGGMKRALREALN